MAFGLLQFSKLCPRRFDLLLQSVDLLGLGLGRLLVDAMNLAKGLFVGVLERNTAFHPQPALCLHRLEQLGPLHLGIGHAAHLLRVGQIGVVLE